MAISIVYFCLLSLMSFVLYQSGKSLQKEYKISSWAGIIVILVWTLNEGLRFGRGIDYNVYWTIYDNIASGYSFIDKDVFFLFICKLFLILKIPYQGFILFLSFLYIIGVLCLMRNFKYMSQYVLPLFLLFSMGPVENMVRWYFGYSLFLIGLSSLIAKEKITWHYVLFSFLACLIHIAFIPIPFVFYLIFMHKKIFFRPLVSLLLFYSIYLFFETDVMLHFSNVFDFITNSIEIFGNYGNNTEYWLTSGFAGIEKTGKISVAELVFISFITILGYKVTLKLNNRANIYAYNLYIVGLLLYPIAKKIELIIRYDHIMFFFESVVLANIVYMFLKRKYYIRAIYSCFIVFAGLYVSNKYFIAPFKNNPKMYMYVWDRENENSFTMIQMWLDEDYRKQEKRR